MQTRKILSFEKSPTVVLMLIWATMMVTYYLTDAPVSREIVEHLCGGPTWLSEAHSLAIFTALAMALTSALVMIFFGKHATPDRPPETSSGQKICGSSSERLIDSVSELWISTVYERLGWSGSKLIS